MSEKYKIWNKDEINILIGSYPFSTKAELMDAFKDRNWSSIYSKICKLHLHKMKDYRREHTISPWNVGLTKETSPIIANISKILKSKSENGYTVWNKGLTKETDDRVAQYAGKGNEKKARHGKDNGMYGVRRYGISNPHYGDHLTKEQKDNVRKGQSLTFVITHRTNIEQIMENILNKLKVSYKFEAWLLGGKYRADFLVNKKIIECDGIYWHDPFYDKLRDIEIRNAGYLVKRFPEIEFNDLDLLEEKVIEWLK